MLRSFKAQGSLITALCGNRFRRLSGGAVFAVLFWYFLLSAAMISKLMSLQQLGLFSIFELLIVLAFIVLATTQMALPRIRICLTIIVVAFLVWNLLPAVSTASAGDCACFGTFPVSRIWLIALELFSVPWLVFSVGLSAEHWQGFEPRKLLCGQILLISMLGPWFGFFAPVNPVALARIEDKNAEVRFAESEIRSNLSGLSSNWLVFYYSPDCGKCKLILRSLASELPDGWLMLLVNAGTRNDLGSVSEFWEIEVIYFFDSNIRVDLPGVLPQACCIINDEVVDIGDSELAECWQQSLEVVMFGRDKGDETRSGLLFESAFENGEDGMFFDD